MNADALHALTKSSAVQAATTSSVVLISHYFPAHGGGVEIVANEIASRLAVNGHASVAWFASAVDEPPAARNGMTIVAVPSINIIERLFHLPYPLWSPFVLPKLWRAIRRADAVHVHDFIYYGSILGYTIAKLLGKPVVVTQHIGAVPYDSVVLRGLLQVINRTLGRMMLGHANRAVFISSAVRDYFLDFTTFRHPPSLLHNGVDHGTFALSSVERREELRACLGLRCNVAAFLFVGRFVEKKGLLLLHGLAQEFSEVQWLFAGTGPLDPAEWNLKNVTVYRDRSGAGLADLYRAADLLVLPSKGEGFPLVVQEAMACGTPVLIGSETMAAMPAMEFCSFSVPVIVQDVRRRWRDAVADLLSRPEQLSEMRDRVGEFARQHWDWDGCTRGYGEIFSELIVREPGSGGATDLPNQS